jgi:hypothetical protein
MNFVGHHEVAARRGLDAPARLGAMLPDFATMLGVRLRRDALPPAVLVGVDLHHETDGRFHPLEAVRRGMHDLSSAVLDEGVGRGAARAVGHVGYEMVLDSVLDTDDLRATLLEAGPDPHVAAGLTDAPDWPMMRVHLATRVAHYDEPEWVADRLFQILQRRPRLAFGPEQIPIVTRALAAAAPAIRDAAPAVFATVMRASTDHKRSNW